MAMASTDPITRRFAVACGVLSQYVKANSPQSAPAMAASGETGLMAAAVPMDAAAVQEPLCQPVDGEQQFTIFYAGRVVVIDRCTPARAAELIRYASAAQSSAPETPALVDMPIARKASLQRFLAKRKDRSTTSSARSPYGRAAAEEQPPAKKVKAVERRDDWLALGSLGDMHSR